MTELYMREFSLQTKNEQKVISEFLQKQGLREAQFDYYAGLFCREEMISGGGVQGAVIKGVAVAEAYRDTGLMNRIVSHLYNMLRRQGERNVFVFTRPCNTALFQSLGFHIVGCTDEAALLESDPDGVAGFARGLTASRSVCVNGCVVMHANPFTNGHLHLLREARKECDYLHVFVLQAERSCLPFALRKALVEKGSMALPNVTVYDGGPYIISPATFPTYFLKKDSDEAAVQARLDAEIFAGHIAPALDITRRFVGEEPLDPMTARYNRALNSILPEKGISLRIVPRLTQNGEPVSASRVRVLAEQGAWDAVKQLVPTATYTYLQLHY